MNSASSVTAADLAASLEQLTSGWKPAPGVAPEALTAARHALAASVIAGKTLTEIHAVVNPIRANTPFNPKLSAELLDTATEALAQPPTRTVAIIRSALSATQSNPLGRPDWARSARILQTFGPFQDLQGVEHWVDLILFTFSIPFAFGSASSPFGVFPYHGSPVPPPKPTALSLGNGSIWFLANLLSSSIPAGNFTGFAIAGGTLTSSQPMSYQSGVYVAPATATITVTASLVPAPPPLGTGNPGADAAAATFTPPAHIKIAFTQTSATFEQINDSHTHAYGSNVVLHWSKGTPVVPTTGQPLVIIPCHASPKSFAFAKVQSNLSIPSGGGPIEAAGWGLPLVATTITSLPEAAGPGIAAIAVGKGVSVTNAAEPTPVPVTISLLEVATAVLYEVFIGKAAPVETTYQLWPQAPPSKLNSTIDFSPTAEFLFVYFATPTQELLYATGSITAFVDRPLDSTGAPFSYKAPGILLIDETKTATRVAIVAIRTIPSNHIKSIALENALLGVDLPSGFILFGSLQGQNIATCGIGLYFISRWLLPTLPDPYAANFDLSIIPPEQEGGLQAVVVAVIAWAGGSAKPVLAFELLPSSNNTGTTGTPFPSKLNIQGDVHFSARRGSSAALLDLSTRVDLFGVALFPGLAELIASRERGRELTNSSQPAPPLALKGLSLALNGALAASFALPQVSWEPMESTASDQPGPILCDPPADGPPLLFNAPDSQQLVPFSPGPLLVNNVDNVATGHSFAAIFSLPFGLDAVIIQPNRPVKGLHGFRSSFQLAGGTFAFNSPEFPESFVPNPKPPIPNIEGAVQLSVIPEHPDRLDASFPGFTEVDAVHGPFIGPAPNGYGYTVLGPQDTSGVGLIFENKFGAGGTTPSVPLRRIDLSGYGASIYSEWIKNDALPPTIIKVQFETTGGRTAYEVVKAFSVLYPYYIKVVRTVTMQRQNAGWVKRSDTGWQPTSPGQFQYPTADWTNHIHPGPLAGVFNVRNIRELTDPAVQVPNPADATKPFLLKKVLFDADLGIASGLKVLNGGFKAPIPGITNPPDLVSSRDIVGYLQIQPDETVLNPDEMRQLFHQVGPLSAAISATIQAGASSTLPGTTFRCTAFQTNIISAPPAGPVPALGVALMGAPQIPRGGGWSMGQRRFTDPAPSALPNDFPVPVVQPTGTTNFWYISDITDILQLNQPFNYYSLMHSTGTNKVLFEAPQIPATPPTPGLQFPKPTGSPKPGGVPLNQGSPNLGDLASILNSTGLFPDIANAISVIQGAIEQINTTAQGFHYTKSYPGPADPPLPKTTLLDLSVLSIDLAYADTTSTPNVPGKLTYTVDSSASPSWSLSVGPLSFEVNVPAFGGDPVLTITGGFYADEHTKAGLTGLNVHMGSALNVIQGVFSKLQALAQFLPGGAGANLNVAVSNGAINVSDSFTIGDLPLGLGDLTDISLDVGLNVQLSPLSVDFSVGIGNPGNPFNWIVSPLAGNGLMDFGVKANQPSFTIQAGIGLGLAIDLGIASGSASITIAVQLNVTGNSITLMAILSGQASVSVLDGLASASLTLTAALGFGLQPILPPVKFNPAPPPNATSVTLGPETVTLLASCSVGIHLSICWVVSVSWDGSWSFSQSITTPQLTVGI